MNRTCITTTAIAPAGFWVIIIGLLAGLWLPAAARADAMSGAAAAQIHNRRCFQCHGQSHLAELPADQRLPMVIRDEGADLALGPELRPELYVSHDVLAKSVHADAKCVDCHPDAIDLPHRQTLAPATCDANCHASAQAAFRRGVHAEAMARGEPAAPTCASCHGGHDILPSSDRQSHTYPLNIVKRCGACHAQHGDAAADGQASEAADRMQRYMGSVHGRAVLDGGLVVAATCADCHGNHTVLHADNPDSPINRQHVAETCGRCHVGIAETYVQSIHGQMLHSGSPDAPTCTDCHTAHSITRAQTPSFMLDIVEECGGCHDRPRNGHKSGSFYKTYRRSYHGQVTELGWARAARCSDCHGAHDIRPIADPRSRLHAANRIEVCRNCHTEASAKFAAFEPHADFHDAKSYPLLHAVWLYFVIMMSGAFGFFGLHCLLWLVRSLIERRRRGGPAAHEADGGGIRRFTRFNRINHAIVIITFFGLTLTGMPLLFADHEWAKVLAIMLGGVNSAGYLHRIFAIALLGNLVAHLYHIAQKMHKRHRPFKDWFVGPSTMLPRWKDVQDAIGMFRWFFMGGKQPALDRWTYWEKFDYIAEVGGSLIIGGSGLLLWFPRFFATFLPGWVFNVAMIIHGYEAMLAVGFIFTIHFFNAHLRPDKFPVDDVIFTGQVPEAMLKHERPTEYARLVETGELESLRVACPPRWARPLSVAIGILAMVIGMTMVTLIILAGLEAI